MMMTLFASVSTETQMLSAVCILSCTASAGPPPQRISGGVRWGNVAQMTFSRPHCIQIAIHEDASALTLSLGKQMVSGCFVDNLHSKGERVKHR